jgi:nicotinamidase-related amidase
MSAPPRLVVIDMQEVFAEPGGPWSVPRFGEIVEPIERLVAAHAPHVTFTRFVAPERPEGAWIAYYERFAFALQPPDAGLYRLVAPVEALARDGGVTLEMTTLSKWGPELAAEEELVLTGVATDSCVIGTALAAADAGVHVRVAADACAGADDAAHEHALATMRVWAPLIDVTSSAEILG